MPEMTEVDKRKANRAFRGRVTEAMLNGCDSVDLRTALSLQIAGLMKPSAEQDTSADIVTALRDLRGPKAPLLILSIPGSSTRTVVATVDLLGSPQSVTRCMALDAILETGDVAESALLPTTTRQLRAARDGLAANDNWQRSAVTILDALERDWLYQLALLRQCLANGVDSAVASHATDLLRPTTEAVANLARDIVGEGPAVSVPGQIAEIVRTARSDIEAIERYVRALGILPLSRPYSAEELLRAFCKVESRDTPRFASLLEWAKTYPSPLAMYHVCRVASGWPEILNDEDWPSYWEYTTAVLRWWADKPTTEPMRQQWQLRSSLVAHFARIEELAAPMPVQSETMCSLAMWQAEHLASVFRSGDALTWALHHLAVPEGQRTGWIWSMARPMASRSLVRFASLNSRLLWGSALLSDIDRNIGQLKLDKASTPQLNSLADTTIAAFVTGFPPRTEANSVFDFGVLPRQLLVALVDRGSEEQRSMLAGVSQLADATMSPEDLLRSIASKPSGDSPNPQAQYLAFRARMLAYVGELPDEAAWEVASDSKWRKAVFVEGGPDVVEPVFDMLCELLTHNPGKWKARFPHMLAETLEQDCSRDADRVVIFGLLVLSCVATETTSALERVVRGHVAEHLHELVATWRTQLLNSMPASPEWVKGRLRATLAVLHA